MAAPDFFGGNNAVTITPVFPSSNQLLGNAIKLEPPNLLPNPLQSLQSPVPVSATSNNDFDDFSSWVKCEFCDYRCPKKDRLSRHVRNVHYKEKPFGCSLCDACFGRKDKMKRHMATVHSQERPYKCEFCNHSSGRKDKIREHIQSVHLKTRPRKPKKKYPKKKKNASTPPTNNVQTALSAISTHNFTNGIPTAELLHLPQHPLPRHELQSGFTSASTIVSGTSTNSLTSFSHTANHTAVSAAAAAGLVTLTPVNFVPTNPFAAAAAAASMGNLTAAADHIQPYHQPAVVAVTNTQPLYKIVT